MDTPFTVKPLLNKPLAEPCLVKCILFDLDGTLIDSVPDLAVALNKMLVDIELSAVAEELAREWVGNGAAKLVERALCHHGINGDELKEIHTKALELFLAHYANCCADKTVLYEGVAEALAEFKHQKITMAIVTNKPRRFIAPILEHLAIDDYFALLLGGDELTHKKPHPEPLLHCIEALNMDACNVLMVGDSRNDIEAARAANIPVVAMNYGYNHGRPIEQDKPDCVFASMAELAKQLAN